MLTAVGHEGILAEAVRIGAVDFVAKPASPEQLRAVLEKVLKKRV